MKYKILIKKCEDSQRAALIAGEIAKWSGSSVDTVLTALLGKDICIRDEADGLEAQELMGRFGMVGARVELIPLMDPVPVAPVIKTAAVASKPGKAPRKESSDDDDDDDEHGEGKILTDQEYTEQCKARADIFAVEKEHALRNLEIICMLVAIITGIYLSTREMVEVATDFFEKMPEERVAKIVKDLPETLQQKKDEDKKKEEEIQTEKKKLTPAKDKGAGGRTGGGGDPRARVTRKGVLGIISGQIKGKTVASADIFGKGGFASGIDAVLQGVGGLKAGGSGGVGRKGAAGIGYGAGYGSGFGGGSGGIDDLIGSLMGGDGGSLDLKKRGSLKISAPEFTKGGALTGGRSRASIMRVVMQNLAALRYAYNQRLREKPGLKGRITVKFAIDEFGKVIFCQVVSSTMDDPPLEETVTAKIKRWVFEKIDKPGDVTEVVYPFVFSQ